MAVFINKKHRKNIKEYPSFIEGLKKALSEKLDYIDEVKVFNQNDDELIGSDYGAVVAVGYWSMLAFRNYKFSNSDYQEKFDIIITSKVAQINKEFIKKHNLNCKHNEITEEYLKSIDQERGLRGPARLMEVLVATQKEALQRTKVLVFTKVGFYESEKDDEFEVQIMAGYSFVENERSMSVKRGESLTEEFVQEINVDEIESNNVGIFDSTLKLVCRSVPLKT